MDRHTPKTILVTGGAGFIGSELVRQLATAGRQAACGHRVRIVDNLINGRRENVADIVGDRVELFEADIRDEALMTRLMDGVHIVYHLACLGVRHSIHSPRENHDVNATATLQLLALSKNAGVERFVCVSSSEVYGTARSVPMCEDHPTFPKTVYGSSKLAGECYARAFHDAHGLPTVVIRPFNAYGPRCHHEGDSGEVIPKFMLRRMAGEDLIVFGDGSQTRDFTYVADTARGIRLAGFAECAVGETINLGSGTEVSILDLAKRICKAFGNDPRRITHDAPRPADVLRLCADTRKAHTLLGFAPTMSLDEGLAQLARWYSGQAISAKELLADERVHNWQDPSRTPDAACARCV